MAVVSWGALGARVKHLTDNLRQFILTPKVDDLVSKVQGIANQATYDSSIWGNNQNMQTLALLREVPQMLKDGVIASCVELIMETSFQTNDEQRVIWPTSKYTKIVDLLERFHGDVNMSQQVLTMANNLLLWGNLPYRHFFNANNEFVNFTAIPDFTAIVPIILSGRTLGFLINGQFHYPYEFTYAQLQYFHNLGGIYQNNMIQLSGFGGMGQGEGEDLGLEFRNEFALAPSYLSRAVRPWKNINIIEDALLLNRMDQSNYYRLISVGVGGAVHSKAAIRTLNYYRNFFKKVRRVSYDANGMVSRGTGQDFEVILPKTPNQSIEVSEVGADHEVRALKDLDMMYNKLFASLRVQPSQIGFGEENTNAIGETNGASYDKRFARTCKTLVYSVVAALKEFDYLYLRSRGYDVARTDWSYGTVSLSVLEDAERAETMAKSIENLKNLTDVLNNGLSLENYNKEYLLEALMGPALRSSGVEIKELLKIPESEGEDMSGGIPGAEGGDDTNIDIDMGGGAEGGGDEGGMGGGDDLAMLGASYQSVYMGESLNVMEAAKLFPPSFIATARQSLVSSESKKFISSASVGSPSSTPVPYDLLHDISMVLHPDTPVDLSGKVLFSGETADSIQAICSSAPRLLADAYVTLPPAATVVVPKDFTFRVSDFSTPIIQSLGRVYQNRAGDLYLTSKQDVLAYLSMKDSGLSCMASEVIYLKG